MELFVAPVERSYRFDNITSSNEVPGFRIRFATVAVIIISKISITSLVVASLPCTTALEYFLSNTSRQNMLRLDCVSQNYAWCRPGVEDCEVNALRTLPGELNTLHIVTLIHT